MWGEWLTLPVKYRDLTPHSQLALTLWDVYGPRKAVAVGGCTLPMFGKNRTLRKGRQRLVVHPGKAADGSWPSRTPGKMAAPADKSNPMPQMQKMLKKYERNEVPRVDWLDRLAFQQIQRLSHLHRDPDALLLIVHLPMLDRPVHARPRAALKPGSAASSGAAGADASSLSSGINGPIVRVADPEQFRDNPVENMYRKLVRGSSRSVVDRNLKPNAEDRAKIAAILILPPTKKLTIEEQDLLWKYRYHLTHNRRALTKFLKCVDWSEEREAQQVKELMAVWVDIGVDDALELLSKEFTQPAVRAFGVACLERASDEDILNVLLQLVQAIRYEPERKRGAAAAADAADGDGGDGDGDGDGDGEGDESTADGRRRNRRLTSERGRLVPFLIERALNSAQVGNYFYWYLTVESDDKTVGVRYEKIKREYLAALQAVDGGDARAEVMREQGAMVTRLTEIMREFKTKYRTESRTKRVERLRTMLAASSASKSSETTFDGERIIFPLALPLNPDVTVTDFVVEKASIFASAQRPLRLTFSRQGSNDPYTVIFKSGDDLRQDQLVIQLITLMDKLMKKENLDLQLTPYKVLATSIDDGMVEFVPSKAFSEILKENGKDVRKYFQKVAPDTDGMFGIDPEVLDRYVRSLAGYSLISFLLAIGDRHLDNLLLTERGHLFHIDFGFVLGHDPKPFPGTPPPRHRRRRCRTLANNAVSSFPVPRAHSSDAPVARDDRGHGRLQQRALHPVCLAHVRRLQHSPQERQHDHQHGPAHVRRQHSGRGRAQRRRAQAHGPLPPRPVRRGRRAAHAGRHCRVGRRVLPGRL